jgi:hypothetical protein
MYKFQSYFSFIHDQGEFHDLPLTITPQQFLPNAVAIFDHSFPDPARSVEARGEMTQQGNCVSATLSK